jgi:outer membrane protein assembly factor BamD (BamD/ComL family)
MAEELKRPLKVFLCHASGDKPAVRALYQRLVRDGVDAWLDKEKLLPGQDWQLEIPKAVRESDVVVVCLSNNSITKEGYIQKELRFALDIATEKPEGTIFLIPARLEECNVPTQLALWQWVDLFEPDGYERLMRSLQLRADKLGLRAGEAIYTDQELAQRFDQLYTEGLAALWVEDWDKAYRRFQAILREKPDHMLAAGKLEEAKRQKYLNDLYTQALDAQKSENWSTAIKLLEKLTGEVADYKDASFLLKSAQKRNQLARLYEEARKLYQAKQWQAVIRVFAQIAAIEPSYQDPDGLLLLAEKEAAEFKRIAELNEIYSRGVRAIDAGQWYEARGLLEQVHKAQIGFLETERLLRKVENEITKIEELKKRNIYINTLYEQTHELVRSKNWRKAFDKIEEIEKLDDHFVDKDGLFEKVRAELAREEAAVQQQNELAARYAEAVRLLKEGKYQEALDKWREVKEINPRYPDRQSVQRTAQKKLAAGGARNGILKPASIIGLMAILLIGIVWLSAKIFRTPPSYISDTPNVSSTASKSSTLTVAEPPKPSASPTPFTSYIWNFDQAAEGWGTMVTLTTPPTVKDGFLKFVTAKNDAFILSPSSLQIPAATTPIITIYMRIIGGNGLDGAIYFKTSKDNIWGEAKRVNVHIKDVDTFQKCEVDMSVRFTWQGTITQLRFDPPRVANAQIEIDYIWVHAP